MKSADCPRDCPRRCSEPNCHNPETCEVWAEHVKRQSAAQAAKKSFYDAETDFLQARGRDKARKIWERNQR